MSQIENQVNSLVLGYLSKINADIIEKNGLFDVKIPDNYFKLFRTDSIKITFNPKLSNKTDYELISPGSSILLKILNECIDFGPILKTKLNSKNFTNPIIRFYFYIIFESIKSKTKLIHIDVETTTQKIVTITDSEIDYSINPTSQQISSDIIDDCYIESIDYLQQFMKSDIDNFKSQTLKLKDVELQNVHLEYKKRSNQIEEKSTILRSKGESGIAFQKLIDENDLIKQDEAKILKILDDKYHITIDFALISTMICF